MRRLVQGADVHVIMTESAKQFIPELTLQTLTKTRFIAIPLMNGIPRSSRISTLADLADLVLIAPATANVIGKMAHGLADDMLTTTRSRRRLPS